MLPNAPLALELSAAPSAGLSRARRERWMVRDVSRLADEPGILASILDSQPLPPER
jgi:hypothetical protein